jgi:hypothetical protein
MAYWPGPGPGTDFLASVSSSIEKEVARYDWVIHMDTAPQSYYDLTNPLRNENFDEAWKLNEAVKQAWAAHPRRFVIANSQTEHFLEKMQNALFVVQGIIEGRSFEEISGITKA